MIDKRQDTGVAKKDDTNRINNGAHTLFTNKITKLNILACDLSPNDELDIDKAIQESQIGLKVLGVEGGASRNGSRTNAIHSSATTDFNSHGYQNNQIPMKQYLTNTAIKLSNTFIQQATLLTKLQRNGEKNITVEHVDVHQGGQAIVGNVNVNTPTEETKK
jgi:hypothetical protein